jgi:hypothetical protein
LLQQFQPTPSTPEPPMRILPRNGPVNPQTTRVHLAPAKVQNMVDPKHTEVHLVDSKNVQHGPVQAGRQAVMGNKPMSYAQAAQGDYNIVVPKRGKAAVQNKPHKPLSKGGERDGHPL